MAEKGDIIKTLHRNLYKAGKDNLQQKALIFGTDDTSQKSVTGELIKTGLSDELSDRRYVILDGTDGNHWYVDIGELEKVNDLNKGMIISVIAAHKGASQVDQHIADTAAELLQPGRIAATGFDAAYPIIKQIGDLLGPVAFFENFILIIVLLFAWILVVLAFFILAIQLFITIIEFKITTLAGFVLIPFALWNKTSFLAERVLGGVISSGIKVMALAIIIGIGSLIFADFATAMSGTEATLKNAMSLVLGALSILGLSIFAPAIAAGLVSGAPQLGAGAAIGTAAAGAATMAFGMGAGAMAAKGAVSMASSAVNAGAKVAGQASGAYKLSKATSGAKTTSGGMTSGIKGVGQSFAGSLKQKASVPINAVKDSYAEGQKTAWATTGGGSSGSPHTASASNDAMPAWAKRMKSAQAIKSAGSTSLHALKDGDRPGASANPSLHSNDD